MKNRIALINPPNGIFTPIYEENLGLSYIASNTRKLGFHVDIFEYTLYNLDLNGLLNNFCNNDYNIYGVFLPGTEESKAEVKKLLNMIKEIAPDSFIIAGGHYATFYYVETLREYLEIDCILLGEADVSFGILCDTFLRNDKNWKEMEGIAYRDDANTICRPVKERITNLDAIEFPARDNLEYIYKFKTIPRIYTSRGCYGDCYFCNVNNFYNSINKVPHWIGRSPENILDEISSIKRRVDIKSINIVDDNFIGPGESGIHRATAFANLLHKKYPDIKWMFSCRSQDVEINTFKYLKECGLNKLFLGIESPNQKTLNRLNKQAKVEDNKRALSICKEIGIDVTCGFIMFTPWTTIEEIQNNLLFLDNLENVDIYTSNYLLSRKGSKFYEDIKITSKPSNIGYFFKNEMVSELFKIAQKKDSIINNYLETGREVWRYIDHQNLEYNKIKSLYMSMVHSDINFMKEALLFVKKGMILESVQINNLLEKTASIIFQYVQDICLIAKDSIYQARQFLTRS